MAASISVSPQTTPLPAPASAPAPVAASRPQGVISTTPTERTGFGTVDQFQQPVPVPVAITTPAPPSAQDDVLTGHMSADQLQALAKLTPADQQTLRDFAQKWAPQMGDVKGSWISGWGEGLMEMRTAILSGQGGTLANLAREVSASDQKSGGQNAQQALVTGLSHGRALTKPDPNTGKSLLQELSALNGGGQTYLGYDRSGLAVNILTDLFTPSGLCQAKGEQDCSALAIAASMRRDPAAYGRMIVSLANGNKVTLPSGQRAELEGDRFDPRSKKSMTNQLFDAGMRDPLQSDLRTGVTAQKVKEGLHTVYGGSWTAMYTPDETEEPDLARRQEAQEMATTIMDAQFRKPEPLFANYNGHWVQVLYTLGSGDNKMVTAMAQDGTGAKKIPLSDFLAHLDGLVFQSNVTVPKWMQNAAWGDPGGGGPLGTQGSDDQARR